MSQMRNLKLFLSLLKCISKTELGTEIQSYYSKILLYYIQIPSRKFNLSFYTDTESITHTSETETQPKCLRIGIWDTSKRVLHMGFAGRM